MGTLLVKNIHTLVTMDGQRQEIRNGALLVRDHVIEQVGVTSDLPGSAEEVLDLKLHVACVVVRPALLLSNCESKERRDAPDVCRHSCMSTRLY